ncbi:WGR domain-containing protein [Acidithiobacillus sp. MC6.1]|nr:WGR domain-containing protein [Acidithiobacillus sp. MC6.1]
MYQIDAWKRLCWTKIDDAQGQRRFYQVEVKQDLFGAWIVIRSWGRIGHKPSRVIEVEVQSAEDAQRIVAETATTRKKHHYLEEDR